MRIVKLVVLEHIVHGPPVEERVLVINFVQLTLTVIPHAVVRVAIVLYRCIIGLCFINSSKISIL